MILAHWEDESANWLIRSKDVPLIIHFTSLSAYCNASLSELGHLLFCGRSNLHVTQLYTAIPT